jgi:hypothetical protein
MRKYKNQTLKMVGRLPQNGPPHFLFYSSEEKA